MPRKVVNKGPRSKPAKGWNPPKGPKQRRAFAARHGAACFLKKRTTKTGLKDYEFPVCNRSGSYDCRGILSAFRRAKQNRDIKTAAKAKRLGKRSGCAWARKD